MEAQGKVVVTQKDQRAAGDRADFDMRTNTVMLTGNVVVTKGEDVLRGQRLVVNLTTGVSQDGIRRRPGRGHVQVEIGPKPRTKQTSRGPIDARARMAGAGKPDGHCVQVAAGRSLRRMARRAVKPEADVFDILALFGRNPRRRQKPASGFWRIDLTSLGGPITALAREALNLPRKRESARDERAAEPQAPSPSPRSQPHRASRRAAAAIASIDRRSTLQRARTIRRQDRPPAAASSRAAPAAHDQRQPRRSRPSSEAFLAAHGVEKSFGGRKVVKGVSLYVRRGEAVGLLGPNGAGKTTVFYMITGLIKADRGRIELDGHDVTGLPMYQRARLGIGYLPQEASIFRGLNVEDNIRAVLEVVEPNRRRREADLNALLEEFNITRLRKTPSIALSGGERRRVEIARALASRPNYMLLDEPFAGIDPIAVGDIQALVRHLTNRGIGVLITDHNVRETLGLTDRAYIIYSGEVLMEGRADDIVNDPEVRRLYLGEEFRL